MAQSFYKEKETFNHNDRRNIKKSRLGCNRCLLSCDKRFEDLVYFPSDLSFWNRRQRVETKLFSQAFVGIQEGAGKRVSLTAPGDLFLTDQNAHRKKKEKQTSRRQKCWDIIIVVVQVEEEEIVVIMWLVADYASWWYWYSFATCSLLQRHKIPTRRRRPQPQTQQLM